MEAQSPSPTCGPQFSAHVYCGQTAGWIKMPLGKKVSLSPGDSVLDGDPAPPPHKGDEAPSPIYGLFLLWPNGWMHQDATWYGCRPQLRGLCVRWRPSRYPPQKDRCFLWPNGWMHQDATWCGGISPGEFELDGDLAPYRKRGIASPNLRPTSIVAKRLHGSRCHLVWG